MSDYRGSEALSNLLGTVGAVIDDEDDLLNPVSHAAQTAGQVVRLIASDHGDGDRQFLSHGHDQVMLLHPSERWEDGNVEKLNQASGKWRGGQPKEALKGRPPRRIAGARSGASMFCIENIN